MPIRPPNLNPPFNIVRASHADFGVRDLAKSRAFYVDCFGLVVTEALRSGTPPHPVLAVGEDRPFPASGER